MPANLLMVKDKVQRYLTDLIGSVEIDAEGRFSFRHGSARLFVQVDQINEESTAVEIVAPLVFNARATPELFHYVATRGSYRFGHLSAAERDDGVSIFYQHTLLGDFLDPDELKWAVFAMANTADELDTQLRSQFGGETFHED
jgi:hypothetical protein